ncbi:MAG: ribosome maturation factor RimM [Ruminococcus sp.]|nr:ribosome maturation factor RimM [Ruminococcus sp.]
MKKYLEIGKIVSVFGIKGEVKVEPWCDSPAFICEFDTLYYKSGTPVEIERSRVHKNQALLKIKGVETPEQGKLLRGRVLYMDRDDVELDEGTYFRQDLIGLTVKDSKTDEEYGKISDVLETGANDVYEITDDNNEKKYIPAIPDVIDSVDLENGVMLITPLEGLFD